MIDFLIPKQIAFFAATVLLIVGCSSSTTPTGPSGKNALVKPTQHNIKRDAPQAKVTLYIAGMNKKLTIY
ncbi:MAG: hypothetical protein IH991_13170 [Planctomycetes bacterium]|nr:hypothetical protein [Planctomycetota bacterium]